MATQPSDTSAHVFLVTNIPPCATDRGLRQCFGAAGACHEINYVKPNYLALVTVEGISPEDARKLCNQQSRPSIANQPLQVTQMFREDTILRLSDVHSELIGYIEQLAKERAVVCQKVNATSVEVSGPLGLVVQFRNELSDYALNLNQGVDDVHALLDPLQEQDVIAAIAASTTLNQLANYLGISPDLSLSGITREEGVSAMLKHWRSSPHPSWQTLASVLERTGKPDLAQRIIRQCAILPVTSPRASGCIPSEEATSRIISSLSPDVLYLLTKCHAGGMRGMVFDQLDKGCVTIRGSSAEEVEANIDGFQSAYQSIAGKVLTDVLHCPATVDRVYVNMAVDDLNKRFDQCVLVAPPDMNLVRIVSWSPRQLDQVKLELQKRLSPAAPVAVVSHGGNHLPLEDSMQLKDYRKLTLKKSVLTKERTCVLVSSVKCDLQCTEGVAAEIDDASCGEVQAALEKEMKRKRGKLGEVVSTAGGGTLQCDYVFHIIEPESSETADWEAWLRTAVLSVLKMGDKKCVKSMAIPDLCAGGLKKDAVARVMIDAILGYQFKTKSAGMADIKIVVSNDATYQCFAQHFSQRKNELATAPPSPSSKLASGAAKNPGPQYAATSSGDGATGGGGGGGGATGGGLPALGAHRPSYGGASASTSQPIMKQPAHMRPLSSSSSPAVYKAATSKSVRHSGGSWEVLPESIDNVEAKPSEASAWERRGGSTASLGNGFGTEPSHVGGDQGQAFSSSSNEDYKCSVCLGPFINPATTACGHTFCSKCLRDATEHSAHPTCPLCKTPITQIFYACPICLSSASDPVTTDCCKQTYCRKCLNDCLKASSYCPTCKRVVRKLLGNQPPGTMAIGKYDWPLPGYENYGTILITYNIPDGMQGPEHPNPGRRYHGTIRTAYLPDNAEGREVLALLQKAWEARMIFTVGTSITTGATDCVVWNDIHHKTSATPGPYGYPDMSYLKRVKHELASRGITS